MHNQISEKNKTSRLVRTISGVVFICLLLPAVALGGWLYFLLISFFTIVACHERLEAPGKNKFPLYRKGIVYVFRLLFAYGGLIQSWAKGNNPFNKDSISLANRMSIRNMSRKEKLIYFLKK